MGEVLPVDPPRQIAWRTVPTPLFVDSSDWRITLEPVGAGTRIVQASQGDQVGARAGGSGS
jgi:hypothetical protein